MTTASATASVTREPVVAEPLSARQVLAAARAAKRAEDRAAAQVLTAALDWADLHPAESIHTAACFPETQLHGDRPVPVAGPGVPLVAEFSIAEFAAAVGIKTEWGAHLLGEALELRHRLPRTWARVTTGDLPAWRARRIARATIAADLTVDAATWVDRQVAHCAHTLGPAQTDRVIEAAIARHMPETLADRARQAAENRHVDIDYRSPAGEAGHGTARIDGILDVADALDLDAAITARATHLKHSGSGDTLDVRRALAIGDLARADLPIDFTSEHRAPADEQATPDAGTGPRPVPGRQVVLFVHLAEEALAGHGGGATGSEPGTARVENRGGHLGHLVTLTQVRTWCQGAAKVVIKPVIDLADATPVMAYEIPDRIREQIVLRDLTCVFPRCTHPARSCDLDHIVPWDPGQTAPDNLAPLCRRHHRLKTHGGWRYRMDRPGVFTWISPHGMTLRRDRRGTSDLTPDRPPD